MKNFILAALIVLAQVTSFAAAGKPAPVMRLTHEKAVEAVGKSRIFKKLEEMKAGKKTTTMDAKTMGLLHGALRLNLNFMNTLDTAKLNQLTALVNASPLEVLSTVAMVASIAKDANSTQANKDQAVQIIDAMALASDKYVKIVEKQETAEKTEKAVQDQVENAKTVAKVFEKVATLNFIEANTFIAALKIQIPLHADFDAAVRAASNGKFGLKELLDCLV